MSCQYYQHSDDNGATSFTVAMPRLTFGRGCLKEVGERAHNRGLKRVALFTDAGLLDGPLVDCVRSELQRFNIDVAIYSDILIEPSDKTVNDAAKFLGDGQFDGVVSVGGGSVIDTCKAALVAHCHGGPINRYFAAPMGGGETVPGKLLPHLACPTTSGTGSECTSMSVLRILDLNCKFVVCNPHMLPDEAIVDPACTDSLPATIVASTGYDLMCHALECYTSKAYTRHAAVADTNARLYIQGSNPWSEISAAKALEIAGQYLIRGVADASDREARDQLMWGATLAGIAFGNTGTHLPHAMSYGITHLMSDITTDDYSMPSPFVPHGISVAVTAPAVFRFTAEATPERHMEAAAYLGADAKGATRDDAGEVLAKQVIHIMRNTGAPNGISGVGFGADRCAELAQSCVRQARAIANAPRESNIVDLENIYNAATTYW